MASPSPSGVSSSSGLASVDSLGNPARRIDRRVQAGRVVGVDVERYEGHQADEVRRLVDWLGNEMKPDAIVLSNLLIGGALPEIRRRLPQLQRSP